MPRRITCDCGKEISSNTAKIHTQSPKCTLSPERKAELRELFATKTGHEWAWKRSGGVSAKRDTDWWISVMRKQTTIEDWSFVSPRNIGVMTPEGSDKLGISRRGALNPSVLSKSFPYTKQQVTEFLSLMSEDFLYNDLCFKDLKPLVDRQFPNFMFLFSDEDDIVNFRTLFLRSADYDMTVLDRLLKEKRGRRISIGQKASDKCKRAAAFSASNLISRWRVTFPHRVLFELIQTLDPDATIEFKLRNKSFDIFSPKLNCLIEMHGDFWHKLTSKTGSMVELVKRNIKNDKAKKDIAIGEGYAYAVFWEGEHQLWEKQLYDLYGRRPEVSIQDAQDKVNKVSGKKRSLRHYSS